MKRYLLIAVASVLLALSGLTSCGVGPTEQVATEVNLKFALSGEELNTAEVPPDLLCLRVTISAPDMDTIVRYIDISPGQGDIVETFLVLNGYDRHFVVEGFNVSCQAVKDAEADEEGQSVMTNPLEVAPVGGGGVSVLLPGGIVVPQWFKDWYEDIFGPTDFETDLAFGGYVDMCTENPSAPNCHDCFSDPTAPGCGDLCELAPELPECYCELNPTELQCICIEDPSNVQCVCLSNPSGAECICATSPGSNACIDARCAEDPAGEGCQERYCELNPAASECDPCALNPNDPNCNPVDPCAVDPCAPGCYRSPPPGDFKPAPFSSIYPAVPSYCE